MMDDTWANLIIGMSKFTGAPVIEVINSLNGVDESEADRRAANNAILNLVLRSLLQRRAVEGGI